MKRSQSVVAALSVALFAAGVVDSSAAAPSAQDSTGPDPKAVEARLRAAGLSAEQIGDVTEFLSLNPIAQAAALRLAGITDPGGDIRTDAAAANFVLGQYLAKKGGDPAQAALLQLESGKLSPRAAINLGQTLKPEHVEVTETEIEQQLLAAGGTISRDKAFLRGRVQRVATILREPLGRLMPSLAEVWIDDKDDIRLVVSAAGTGEDLTRVLGKPSFAGIEIEVRTVRYSATTIRGMAKDLRRDLDRELRGDKITVVADTVNSVMRVRAADADTDKRLRSNGKVKEKKAKGDLVIDEPKALRPSALVGAHLNIQHSCRWAFSSTSGSAKKFITAAHCGSGVGGYDGAFVVTTFEAEYQQDQTDAARHGVDASLHPEFDNFVERPGLADLEITGKKAWANVGYNDVVCHSGSTHSCGWVYARSVSPDWVPSGQDFVMVHGPTMNDQPGDSGGPWYYGNNAFGIHAGGSNTFGSWDEWGIGLYGAIDFAEANVGFSVMTK